MRDALELVVVDVRAVTVGAVEGADNQIELVIWSKRGALELRLIGRNGTPIRLTDKRRRDRRAANKRTPRVTVAFADRED